MRASSAPPLTGGMNAISSPIARLEVGFDIFLVDGEADRIAMAAELGKFDDQLPPNVADGGAVGKLARQLGRVGALAQRREQFDRERIPLHLLSR